MHIIVQLNKHLVIGDDRSLWVGIIVDRRLVHNVVERGVLNLHTKLADLALALLVLVTEEDLQARRLDVVRDVDDLFKARDTKSDVLS